MECIVASTGQHRINRDEQENILQLKQKKCTSDTYNYQWNPNYIFSIFDTATKWKEIIKHISLAMTIKADNIIMANVAIAGKTSQIEARKQRKMENGKLEYASFFH